MKIKFKPEFEQKLRKLGIKKKFIHNCKVAWQRDGLADDPKAMQEAFDRLGEHETWESFIGSGFFWNWPQTPEGREFWGNISEK